MTARRFAVLLAALVALPLTGCATSPSLHYRVDFAHADSSGVPVTVEIQGVPRDSLVLEGYLESPLMTVRDAQLIGANGAATDIAVGLRNAASGDGASDFPVIRLTGPLPSHVTLRYRAVLGTREGNDHTGFTGRLAGFMNSQFALAGGRSLFMVPSPAGRMRSIEVRFDLPSGWSPLVPWERSGEGWRVGVAGSAPVEDLLWSALGFGVFDEQRVELHGTAFRFCVEHSVAAADRDSARRVYEAIARRTSDAFGRGLGKEFTVLVAPALPDGDEIIPEGWARGVGATLAPVTTQRARQVAEGVIDAYLAQDPYKTTVRDPKERWLINAASKLLPWRALEAAGLARREDIDRSLAADLAGQLENNDPADLEWNLEQLANSELETALARESLAPLALLRIGELARAVSGGRDSLDSVLRRVFAGKVALSVWNAVPSPKDPRWAQLRARYVRGEGLRESLTGDPLFAMAMPTDAPVPAAGAVTHRLTLAVTGNTYCYLENCGCKVNQAGGIARRATVIKRLRAKGAVLALDAGNALIRAEHFPMPDALAHGEELAYVRAMAAMGYPVAVAGPAELGYGLQRFREVAAAKSLPFLIANASDSSGALAPGWRITQAGGVRVGVIALMEPGSGPWANDVLERRLGGAVAFEDPLVALRRVMPTVRAQSDVVIAMGHLSPPTIRRMIAAVPDLDVVISTDDAAGVRVVDDRHESIVSGDAPGFHGRALVLYANQSSYGVNGATLGLDAQQHVASVDLFATWLGDSIPDDVAVRGELTRFYDTIGRTQAAHVHVPPLFAADPAWQTGALAGAARCATCHASEHAQWKETPHASAWKTLLDVHRNYQPRCVVCHSVGFGRPQGYALGSSDLKLVGVQCENCHGPGAAHAAAPSKANIRRVVQAEVCLECHNPDHSDHFVYDERLPRVMHEQIKTVDAAGGE